MSSEKTRGKRVRRKSEVSWGRLIRPGLVGPKSRPKGVDDGQSVNIQIPPMLRYQLVRDAGSYAIAVLEVRVEGRTRVRKYTAKAKGAKATAAVNSQTLHCLENLIV
jgi:hypothetical protein